ncbi:MAG: hypothetical protein HYX24_02095, partial [Candidatus Aenigmarchaeota archaeon]|nr:hypothetical protein [Candidatus Aenigmarchaeota archaeon]
MAKKAFLAYSLLFAAVAILFLGINSILTYAQSAGFSCDSGTLSDVCVVSTTKNLISNTVIDGSGSLRITGTGTLVTGGKGITISMGRDVTIDAGGKIDTSNQIAGQNGGNIVINAENVTISGNLSASTASCPGQSSCGKGGDININAAETFGLSPSGSISTSGTDFSSGLGGNINFVASSGGNVEIRAGEARVMGDVVTKGGKAVAAEGSHYGYAQTVIGGDAGRISVAADGLIDMPGRIFAYGGNASIAGNTNYKTSVAGRASSIVIKSTGGS